MITWIRKYRKAMNKGFYQRKDGFMITWIRKDRKAMNRQLIPKERMDL